MEDHKLTEYLYDFILSNAPKAEKPDGEERQLFEKLLEQLRQSCGIVCCEMDVDSFFQSKPYEKACGYHRDHGYFYIVCGDRDEKILIVLEQDAEMAHHRLIARLFDAAAYESALKRKYTEEKRWTYCCPFDYRKIWFEQALAWLAPVVDWQFFAECARNYEELLNYWFKEPHWEYDYELAKIIEISDSTEQYESRNQETGKNQ